MSSFENFHLEIVQECKERKTEMCFSEMLSATWHIYKTQKNTYLYKDISVRTSQY